MEAELDKRFLFRVSACTVDCRWHGPHLFVNIELAEDLGRIKKMLVLDDSVIVRLFHSYDRLCAYFFALNASRGRLSTSASQ
jgi:hypothetical protein